MTSKSWRIWIKKYEIWESPDVLQSCQPKSTFWQQSFKCMPKLDRYYLCSILSTLLSSSGNVWKISIKKNCKVQKRGKIFEGRLLLSDQLMWSRLSWQQSNSSRSHVDRQACPRLVFVYLYLLCICVFVYLYLRICTCMSLEKIVLLPSLWYFLSGREIREDKYFWRLM